LFFHYTSSLVFFTSSADPPYLHSFPTRRSSDLRIRLFMRPLGLLARLVERRKARSFATDSARFRHHDRTGAQWGCCPKLPGASSDRKSTRLNSSHQIISYAVFCLKKKNT